MKYTAGSQRTSCAESQRSTRQKKNISPNGSGLTNINIIVLEKERHFVVFEITKPFPCHYFHHANKVVIIKKDAFNKKKL